MRFEVDIFDEFYRILEQIPEGYVSTYGDIALALGDIVAARAVGQMLSENKDPTRYPCHRVVSSEGTLGGFTHPLGLLEKTKRLKAEGIKIVNGRIDNFQSIRFVDFKTDHPLARYRRWASELQINDNDNRMDCLRALDISYHGYYGIGVGVTFGRENTYNITIKKIKAPYIPNYLYLREGEIFESLVEPDCINIIDGNGILHRDRRGVATVVGITTGTSTIGIAKSILTGVVKGDRIFLGKDELARLYRGYVISRGNNVDFEYAFKKIIESPYFPLTSLPDKLSRRYKNEILPFGYSL